MKAALWIPFLAILLAVSGERAFAQCWVTGSGTILFEGIDAFEGVAHPGEVPGSATGVWEHVTADGRYLHGTVDRLRCTLDGGNLPGHPVVRDNLAELSGSGTFEGEPVTFRVHLEDRGEGADKFLDLYSVRIFDAANTFLYGAGGLLMSGNVQFHPLPSPKK